MSGDQQVNRRVTQDHSSSDENFQEDTRSLPQPQRSSAVKRKNQSDAAPRSSPKKPRALQRRPDVANSNGLDEAIDVDNNQNVPVPSQAEIYREVNAVARQRTALQPSKPQTRTPWSADETERLVDLITMYGGPRVSWSLLKNMDKDHADGALFGTRDQVALKDKARNIKFDYLK